MSETMYESPELAVTNFYGGEQRGRCVQLTLSGAAREQGYVQLTRKDFSRICNAVMTGIPVPNADNWKDSLNPDDLEHLEQARCSTYEDFVNMWNREKATARRITLYLKEQHYPCFGCSIIARKLGLEEEN